MFSLFGITFYDFAYLPASNTWRGILIDAKQSDVPISDVLMGCYSLMVRVCPTLL